MKHFLITTLFFSISTIASFAQNSIKGIVYDETGNPLIGTTIFETGTGNGTLTDIDGSFILQINSNSITASYIGYKTQDIVIDDFTQTLDITLVSDELQLQDIVVTANKRSQVSQEVPMSISTISLLELKRIGAFEADDYFSSIPNLSRTPSGAGGAGFGDGRSSGRNIAIRGVSGTNTTVMYLDDTPLPEFADPQLFDISRVEVLRGPQGSLYGSSTMGGAVKIVTNSPNAYKTEGNLDISLASVTEGDLDYRVQGIFNIPLKKEKLALRAGGFYNFKTGVYDRRRQTHFNGFPLNTSDGSQLEPGKILGSDPFSDAPTAFTLLNTAQSSLAWEDNVTEKNNIDDESSYGITAALGIYPTENISIIPKIIIQSTKGDGYDFADIRSDNFLQYRSAGIDESYELDLAHYSLLSRFKFGRGELVNSLSYSQINQVDFEDVSEVQSSGGGSSTFGPPFGIRGGNVFPEGVERLGDLSKVVEELRFLSDFEGKFNFTTGLFMSFEKSKFDVSQDRALFMETIGITNTDLFYFQDTDINTNEFAFFGELYYSLTRKLQVTLGFRVFQAEQDFNQLIGGLVGDFNESYTRNPSKNSGFNPKFNLTYNIDSKKLIYLDASRGFRLGGGNPFVPVIFAGDDLAALGLTEAPATYDADYIWSYELGSKNTLLGNRLILNAAVFHNIWNSLQQRVFLPSGYLFLDNVGAATTTGFEFDLKGKVSKNLKIGVAMGVADAKIEEGSDYTGAEKGDRILNVPKFTASGNIEYSHRIAAKEGNTMYYRVDFQHTGERVNTFDPENQPRFVFAPFTLVNVRIGYTTQQFELALFGKNIFNEIANFGDITSLTSTPYLRTRYATSRPASFGVSIGYNFGTSNN